MCHSTPENHIYLQMARTQKNKATALHLGILKARLAKLRRELITPKGGGGATGEGKRNSTLSVQSTWKVLATNN